jgi:hypothetical protein
MAEEWWEGGPEEEAGIPGHAGRGVAGELQRSLKNLGCRFEAEGDMVRIHVGSAVVELKDEPERGAVIEAVIPLLEEAPLREEEISEAVEDAAKAARILYKAARGLRVEYELDTSLPGYPMLRARCFPESYRAAAERLLDAVMSEGC